MQFGRWSVDRLLSDSGDFFILTLDIWMEQFKNAFNELFQYNQKMYVDKHTHTHTHTHTRTHACTQTHVEFSSSLPYITCTSKCLTSKKYKKNDLIIQSQKHFNAFSIKFSPNTIVYGVHGYFMYYYCVNMYIFHCTIKETFHNFSVCYRKVNKD